MLSWKILKCVAVKNKSKTADLNILFKFLFDILVHVGSCSACDCLLDLIGTKKDRTKRANNVLKFSNDVLGNQN